MSDLDRAVEALESGGLVGVPTDTVYGIAAIPFDDQAIRSLFDLKGRSPSKPIAILGSDVGQLQRVAVLDEQVAAIARPWWPGPLTIVVRRAPSVPRWVGDDERDTVAVRIPDHPVTRALLDRIGPLAATSANMSDEQPALDHVAARQVFGDQVALYLEGDVGGTVSSTVVDVTGPRHRILREGPVAWEVSA